MRHGKAQRTPPRDTRWAHLRPSALAYVTPLLALPANAQPSSTSSVVYIPNRLIKSGASGHPALKSVIGYQIPLVGAAT